VFERRLDRMELRISIYFVEKTKSYNNHNSKYIDLRSQVGGPLFGISIPGTPRGTGAINSKSNRRRVTEISTDRAA